MWELPGDSHNLSYFTPSLHISCCNPQRLTLRSCDPSKKLLNHPSLHPPRPPRPSMPTLAPHLLLNPPCPRLCPCLHLTPHSIHRAPPGHLCPRSHLTSCSIHRAPQAVYAHARTSPLTPSMNQRVKRLTFALGSCTRCTLARTPMRPWASTLLHMRRWDTHARTYTAPTPPSELQVCCCSHSHTHTQCMQLQMRVQMQIRT